MITFHSYEGKNLETLKENCLNELNLSEENVYFNCIESEAGLFKAKKIVLEAISKDEIIDSIKNFINELSNNMNLEIASEIKISDNIIDIVLVSNNNNILIGKDGKTLNALQIVMKQTFSNLNKFGLKITVDVGNYKIKKIKNLQREIKKVCEEILTTKVEVKLDPMNSYERRIVHEVVSNYPQLKSESFDVDPNRYTVIKYND